MKIVMIAFLIAVAIVTPPSHASTNVRGLQPSCSPTNLCGICSLDCDNDEDCAPGLLCADKHKAELTAAGLDPRKADCGPVGANVEEVCFDADLIKLGVCEFDCDLDSDCKSGLWCADAHKAELAAAGLNQRKANCGNVGGKFDEVCFDPNILCNMNMAAELVGCWDIEAENGGTWTFTNKGEQVRFDFDDSLNCDGSNSNTQVGIASSSFEVGCGGTMIDLDVTGLVEGQSAGYDFLRVKVDDVLIYEAQGQSLGTGCDMTTPQVSSDLIPYAVTPGEHVLTLETDTNDGLYHKAAYYEVAISFS
jgi:hypothetical protein